MSESRGRYWIPIGAFAVAVLLSIVTGPTGRLLAMRMQQSTTSQQCTLLCGGTAGPGFIQYKFTRVVFPPDKQFKTRAQVVAALEQPLENNINVLDAAANCNAQGSLAPLNSQLFPGSIQCLQQGPSFYSYAHATAQITSGPRLIQTGSVKVSPALVPPFFSIETEPLEIKRAKTGEFETAQRADPSTASVVSYGCVDTLAMGDSAIIDEIKETDALFIKGLLGAIKKIAGALGGLGFEATEKAADFALEHLVKIGLEMDTTAGYSLKVSLCTGRAKGGANTLSSTRHNDEGERIGKTRVEHSTAFAVSLDCSQNPMILDLKSSANASAEAFGVRGEAISAMGNLWGYAMMMCCTDDNGVKSQIGAMRDVAQFTLSKEDKQAGRFPNLQKFDDLRVAYAVIYDAQVPIATQQVMNLQCPAAQKTLQAMHQKLGGIVESAP